VSGGRPGRAFEDLAVGEQRRSGGRTVTRDEIVSFAQLYDPQWFHNDVEAARDSVFGEVVASGIHTLAIWRQLDHQINGDIDFVCGVGWDNVRMKAAVRAGDTIHVTSEILSLRPSRSRTDRGTAVFRYAVINQHGADVVTFDSTCLVYRRRSEGNAAG